MSQAVLIPKATVEDKAEKVDEEQAAKVEPDVGTPRLNNRARKKLKNQEFYRRQRAEKEQRVANKVSLKPGPGATGKS